MQYHERVDRINCRRYVFNYSSLSSFFSHISARLRRPRFSSSPWSLIFTLAPSFRHWSVACVRIHPFYSLNNFTASRPTRTLKNENKHRRSISNSRVDGKNCISNPNLNFYYRMNVRITWSCKNIHHMTIFKFNFKNWIDNTQIVRNAKYRGNRYTI